MPVPIAPRSLSPAVLHVKRRRVCVSVLCRQARVHLADGFRGEQSRVIPTPGVKSRSNGVAVSRDGSTLLVSDYNGGSHAIHEFRVRDWSLLRVIGKTKTGWFGGCSGDGRLQFKNPGQVWVASDDYVFVAEFGNNRVQVLTPRLDFHGFVGADQLKTPAGVCADEDVIIVSERDAHRISVFNRGDSARLRRFGSKGSGDGQLQRPRGLCFTSGHRHVAVADSWNNRVSVFSVEGEFVRHVGVDNLSHPHGVACSALDELVVADRGNSRVVVFSAGGQVLETMAGGNVTGVAIHGPTPGTIFAQDYDDGKCTVFKQSRVIATPGVKSTSNGVAVSRDGSTLLVSDWNGGSDAIHEFRVADGSRLRIIGGVGDPLQFKNPRQLWVASRLLPVIIGGVGDPLQFKNPRQLWVASDDHVFVADHGNDRVQLLTPRLDFHGFVGVGQLSRPAGVCADDDVIVVSEYSAHRISVFNRGDGTLLRRFGSYGIGDGQLNWPLGLCFRSGHRHVAVADCHNSRVSVFSVEGEFVRHVGVGQLDSPTGVACSAFDGLVVADYSNERVVVFSASGEVLKTMGRGHFSGVAIHGGTIFAQDCFNAKCILFK